jgi:hypothetical protein
MGAILSRGTRSRPWGALTGIGMACRDSPATGFLLDVRGFVKAFKSE